MRDKILLILYLLFNFIAIIAGLELSRYLHETRVESIPVVISENGVYKMKGMCDYKIDYNISWYLDRTLYIDIKNVTVVY